MEEWGSGGVGEWRSGGVGEWERWRQTAVTTWPQHFAPWRTTGRRSSKARASWDSKTSRMSGGMSRTLRRSRPISPTPALGLARSLERSSPSTLHFTLSTLHSSSVSQGWTPKKSRPISSSRTDESPQETWQCASVISRPCGACLSWRHCGRQNFCRRLESP